MEDLIVGSEKKVSKKAKVIIGVIAAVIILIVIVIAVFSMINVKAMNSSVDLALDAIKENHTLTKIEESEYDEIKLNAAMKFDVDHYYVENVGNLSVMKLNMGLMQMATFVLTPDKKDIPLLSADYMYMLPIRKTYLEIYDLVINDDDTYKSYLSEFDNIRNKYDNLKNLEHSEDWYSSLLTVSTYKQSGVSDDAATAEMLAENVDLMLRMADEYPELNSEQQETKRAIIVGYSDGLIEKGGISTDVFKKSLGKEKTKDFFDKVFFGTERNK